jgi:hypothetical protein
MAKKDAVSKRLAEEIDFAKHIKKKDSPSFSLLDLASPDEKEKLAASESTARISAGGAVQRSSHPSR